MQKWSGIYASLPTPFDWQGDVYPVKVQHNVARWNRVALAGYLVGGSAGEASEISFAEKTQLFALVKEAADPTRALLAGVGAESLRKSIELSQKAAELGYTAIVAEPASRAAQWDRATALTYFRTLADRCALPVVVSSADHETAIAASQHPNVTAVIAADPSSLKGKLRDGVALLTGSAKALAHDLQSGASAALLAYAAALPYTAITIWEATQKRESEAAADWQHRIAQAVDLIEADPASLKHALDLTGYYGGPPRLPLSPISTALKAAIERALDGLRG